MKKKFIIVTLLLALCAILIESCTQEASSRPHFIFKTAPTEGIVAQFMGEQISTEKLYQGVRQDLYEAQMKVYRIKLEKLKSHILEKLVAQEAKQKGMTNDQFLEQVIAKNIKVASKEIESFAKERGVTKEQLNDALKGRIENILTQLKQREAIERWLAVKTAKNPVEVYFSKPARPIFDVSVEGSPYMGGDSAKVVIAEFSDFQCQYCKKGAEFLRDVVKRKYGNKVKIAFKNYPLSVHNDARTAALASLCAQDQGKDFFWKMHDKMFENQEKLDKESIMNMAEKMGLKMQDFAACMESKQHMGRIDADVKQGRMLGVQSTPTFFINGKVVKGVGNREEFIRLIDEELAK